MSRVDSLLVKVKFVSSIGLFLNKKPIAIIRISAQDFPLIKIQEYLDRLSVNKTFVVFISMQLKFYKVSH